MADFKSILPTAIESNPFKMIGEQWMLITAERMGKVNAMTASWGSFGVMWNKPVVFVVIRQNRYTKEFVDASERFSLNFFSEEHKKDLRYFGSVSGRDEDKIATSHMKVIYKEGVPVFEDAKNILVCRKLFAQKLDEQCFIDKSILSQFYTKDSMHTLYIAQIENVLISVK